jgi:hypothetical protein
VVEHVLDVTALRYAPESKVPSRLGPVTVGDFEAK